MKKSFLSFFVLFFLVLHNPAHSVSLPSPNLAARSWLLMDVVSNQVLASKNADDRIASRTASKLMTAYLVFGALRDGRVSLDQPIVVSEQVARLGTGGPEMFLQNGGTATVRELLLGLIVRGGDDAALALAIAVSGDEKTFVELMNREAVRLGMKSTLFAHPYGSSGKEGYSTPSDMAVLALGVMRDFSDYSSFFSTKEFSYNGIRMRNGNRLLWLDGAVDGLFATNSPEESYTLLASAKRDSVLGERRMLSIVTGAVSDQARMQESLKLLNWGFQNFDMIRLFEKNQIVATPEVWKGSSGKVEVGFNNDTFISVPKGAVSRMKSVLVRNDPLIAPIDEGSRIGILKIVVDDKVIAELPVVALEQINVASFLGRLWDTIRLWFK
ncbi:D-alanyl-D-alanine carboxypeptidase family protein [Oxalobacter paraformigenes]|uniref:serine-type D-Ala-D-Ala carboxypeptidase n=1 Tax=Oxalobacter paraformigenes TaxID=556268 RepID=C3X605_9BURK|nr:D-alanyl-D-alanine carboxypeptidase family protein [Oxalobacter paraformigenes]EEO28641.1 hypothetical protein OFAG_01794 [Oxalobacter paraformigenes]